MKNKMTHIGCLIGCDARTHREFNQQVELRETKNFWVDLFGRKYSKKFGLLGVGEWPLYRLQAKPVLIGHTP
jgi:hypothetical protein